MTTRMNYQQYRTAKRLVHSCCNYDGGCCLLVDNGEECVCPQSITYPLICKWFRAAVLPLDGILYAALFPKSSAKVCVECQCLFRPGSNWAKYCPACAAKVHRSQKTASERRRRASGVDN